MTYLSQNIEHLARYTQRGLNLPEGIEYRGMGTLEGSNHNVICDRMKNRGMSWSIEGAENMAKLLCLKHSNMLKEVFASVLHVDKNADEININELVEKYNNEPEKNTRRFLKDTKKATASCGCHFSPIPFTGIKRTNGRKAIQNMLKNKMI